MAPFNSLGLALRRGDDGVREVITDAKPVSNDAPKAQPGWTTLYIYYPHVVAAGDVYPSDKLGVHGARRRPGAT